MTRFAYDAQIASSPDVVQAVLDQPAPPALDPARPILFSGIGTSLHAARVAAGWINRLSGGHVRPHAIDAHDLGTGVVPVASGDQVVVISHRGNKLFPTATLARARQAGAMTVAIVGAGAPEQASDHTVRVCPNEIAGTFSVSYLASLTALAQMAAPFEAAGETFARALPKIPDTIARTLALPSLPAPAVAGLAEARVLLIVGFGDDFTTAQEAALKLKEGAWMWSEAMSPEFAMHGTPAGFQPGLAALLIDPVDDDGGRTALLRSVLDRLALGPLLTCGEAHGDGLGLAFASPPHPLLRQMLAILPFHRLTAELARLRGTDPDTLHGNREPWREIMTGLRL